LLVAGGKDPGGRGKDAEERRKKFGIVIIVLQTTKVNVLSDEGLHLGNVSRTRGKGRGNRRKEDGVRKMSEIDYLHIQK